MSKLSAQSGVQAVRIFKYKGGPGATLWFACIFVAAGIILGISVVLRTKDIRGIYISLVWAIIWIPLFALIQFQASDVIIDEEGIAQSCRGRVWKKVKWSDIKRIAILELFDPGYYQIRMTYMLFVSNKRRLTYSKDGPMSLSPYLENRDELLEIVKSNTASRGIIPVPLSSIKNIFKE